MKLICIKVTTTKETSLIVFARGRRRLRLQRLRSDRSVSVGHLGLIAIRLGRKLKWNPDEELFVNDSEADRLLSRPMRSPWHI
ncbi:MAG: hypothetical protein ACYSU3_21365 [Planctomycetota bacterium]